MEQASSALSTGVPALAAIPQLAENSRLGFQPVARTSRWGSGFSISCNTLGLSTSLYDGDAGSRSTGKERDTESGNDYFGARYFASSMGRFLSPDPSGLEYADPTNPQSLNLYSYVLNRKLANFSQSPLCR
jgi:RHS repeat-associated protein